jgi:hypothetical protein
MRSHPAFLKEASVRGCHLDRGGLSPHTAPPLLSSALILPLQSPWRGRERLPELLSEAVKQEADRRNGGSPDSGGTHPRLAARRLDAAAEKSGRNDSPFESRAVAA